MEFRVGQIIARCVKCEGTVFEEQRREGRRGQTLFSCASCKEVTSYSEVIAQIGQQASSRTRERLGASRTAPPPEKFTATGTVIGTTTVPSLIMRAAKVTS
jgi:hypothetical protein